MLTLWGRPSSINVQKVMWALAEIGLPHRHIDAGGDAGGLDTPAFRALNPHGRVPVIQDGDVVVWESNAIVRYLCGRYATGALAPESPAARAVADQWMDWSLADFQRDMMRTFWDYYRTPASQRRMDQVEQTWARTGAHLQRLDGILADRPFLAGQGLTMADIPAGTLLHRCFGMGLEAPEVPNLQAWRARLIGRPAYQETVMQPFDALFGRLAF